MGELIRATAPALLHPLRPISMKHPDPDRNPTPRPTSASKGLTASFRRRTGLLLLLPLLASFHSSVSAQSASNFAPRKVEPSPAARRAAAAATAPAPAPQPAGTTPVEIGPSRYVGESDLAAYVATIASAFSINSRETDPFGQFQDPEAKPVIKTPVASPSRRATPTFTTPFSDIVRLIQVTTIMPGEQKFLIGTRSFRLGDRFPIAFRGRNTNVEITSVSSRKIGFRNVDSDETATLELKLLPVGMTPGNGKITAPGMVLDRPDSPLELEPDHSFNAPSQN